MKSQRIAKFACALLAGGLALALVSASPARAEDAKKAPAFYPVDKCPVSGKPLGASPVTDTINGREVRFCCKDCPKTAKADAAQYLKKLDDMIIAAQLPSYPTETCVVSNDKLGGDMGDPINFVQDNRLIRLCCKSCIKDLKKDPAKFFGLLDKAVIEKESKDYPLDSCPISGEKLGKMGEPKSLVYGGHLVKLCCAGCEKDFNKDPGAVLKKIEDARKAKGGAAKPADAKPAEAKK